MGMIDFLTIELAAIHFDQTLMQIVDIQVCPIVR